MKKQKTLLKTLVLSFLSFGLIQPIFSNDDVYGPFPITLKGASADCSNSVSYTGQIARHVQHDSLKSLVKSGDLTEMMAYYKGSDKNKTIHAPVSNGDFKILQGYMAGISSGKNLSGKTYKGIINGWPGDMTGPEVLESMITKAAVTGGKDVSAGYDYQQLISKFAMGAVFYNAAVDGYLDEKLAADTKPNGKAYKNGACYTGKEHVWDEAWGYWGAAAHSLTLTAEQNYNVAKRKDMASADYNKDGKVDLKSEYVFAHAYYASSFDKGGNTNYLETINRAFLDGRKLITSANGENLNDAQRAKLLAYADTIATNWQKVIAEAVFKYAGETYETLVKLETVDDADLPKLFGKYMKYWGELKGFALALQTGKSNLGETAVGLNRMVGMGPMLMDETQVVGMDADGNYVMGKNFSWNENKLHMLKVQKLMVDVYGVTAKSHDQLGNMSDLAATLGSSDSAEND